MIQECRGNLLVKLQVPYNDCAWENIRLGRSLLLKVPWKNDPVGRMTPCISLNNEDDYYREKAR